MSEAESAGLALLRERALSIPGHLEARARPDPLPNLAGVVSVVVTGAGSSAAQAELLVDALAGAAVPARFAPPSRFLAAPDAGWARDALVVVSQGLAPNARLALARADAFRASLLLTAVSGEADDPTLADALARFAREGGRVVRFAGGSESGALVRLVGPVTGSVAALRLAPALAQALGGRSLPPPPDATRLAEAFRSGLARGDALLPGTSDPLDGALVLLAGGGHVARCANLATKLMEGLLAPRPALFDLLDFAHGGYQQLLPRRATLIVLERADAPEDAELVGRLGGMLELGRHRLLRLRASLPGAFALVEHEAMLDALLLRALEARRIDPLHWPGQGRDGPLYEVATPGPRAERPEPPPQRRLETLTWPELEEAQRRGARTAVVPLGSTEQHGPHLPFATDSWIADALAERLCARVPDAVRLPALALGCASEHASFPGTLSLTEETLAATLRDLVASLERGGFERVFVFSAHGGNLGALRRHAASLAAGAERAQVVVFTDHEGLQERLLAEAREAGVDPAAAGQHAGELETSILLALAPGQVREARARAGLLDTPRESASVFYPDLRANAPDGVVGDPRGAREERAEAYLGAWVSVLLGALEDAKKRQCTKGTKKA